MRYIRSPGKEVTAGTVVQAALVAGIVCLLVYLRALACGFVNLDDPYFVLNNTFIRQIDGKLFAWALNPPNFDLWIPLTWISFAIDYHFWQLNPLGYHLTNILLHSINTALVVLIADRIYRSRFVEPGTLLGHDYLYSGRLLLAGLLFGIHPLRVESVAWVTERKDVLNGVFTLASIFFYLRYAQKKETGEEGASREYLLSLVLFMISLTAKSVSVVVPMMLLLADWYPLGRLRRGRILPALVEKLPYLVLSATVSIMTIVLAAQNQLLTSFAALPFGQRLAVSGNAVFEYCRLLLYPVGILPYYVIPDPIPHSFTVKTAAVLGFTILCLFAGRKWSWLLAGWLCFIIPLLPVLAFIQNGDQALAARYTYLPSVAPSIIAAAACAKGYAWLTRTGHASLRYLTAAIVVTLLLSYAWTTVRLINVWQNSGTLWTRVIDSKPLGRAYCDRGIYYLMNGKSNAAADDFSAAIDIAEQVGMPSIYNLFAFRGTALGDMRRYDEAVKDFDRAIAIFPHPRYFHQRGVALRALGRFKEAEEDFDRAGNNPPAIDWFERSKSER